MNNSLKIENINCSGDNAYINNSRWHTGSVEECKSICNSSSDCKGFNYVKSGPHSGGHNLTGSGACYFRTDTSSKSTDVLRDCYEKLIPAAPTMSPTNAPTNAPVTAAPTPRPKLYLVKKKDYTKPSITNVMWPDTLINPIYVEFRFRYTENPVSNACIIDCQNQSKLYAGWKVYFRGTQKTLVLQIGTMGGGVTTNEYVYHYKQLQQNVFYTIKLAFHPDSVLFDVGNSEISMTGFNTSLPALWDPNIYIGQDNQYANRSLVDGKFKVDNLYVFM